MQKVVVRFRVDRTRARQTRLLLWCQLDLDRLSDGGRYLVLNCQNIAQVAIVCFGPKMFLGRRVNQSYRDSYFVADALD